MKKVLTIAAVVALTASFTSCKKDYTCDCTYTYEVLGVEETVDYTYEYNKVKKKDATEACDAANAVSGYECTLN
jgi:hypothetical protein